MKKGVSLLLKTYITTMPDRIGAFLKACECFAELGINIKRVNYNKAIDSQTLFIDVEGDEERLLLADKKLSEIGYLQDDQRETRIILLEFQLRDVAGSGTSLFALINEFNFNISYLSSRENDVDSQLLKVGLFVDDEERLLKFIRRAEKLCNVRVLDYNHSEKVYDNSIFYRSFVSGISKMMGLSDEYKEALTVNTNLAMQMLDDEGISPQKTFKSIHRCAEMLAAYRGEAFNPRISRHQITEKTEIITIEPPCGSNTTIILSGGEALFVDCGYALYHDEMLKILRSLIPNFDTMHKCILLTHSDFDHCGLLPIFDEIITSKKSAECLRMEYEIDDGFREMIPLHKPYVEICKILSRYMPPHPDRVTGIWERSECHDELLAEVGCFAFGDLHFSIYEGKGGHVLGETVFIDREHKIAFTGDIYINVHGMTPEQTEYNRYAPILMTTVDTDPKLCALERKALMEILGEGDWQIFVGHGYKKDLSI